MAQNRATRSAVRVSKAKAAAKAEGKTLKVPANAAKKIAAKQVKNATNEGKAVTKAVSRGDKNSVTFRPGASGRNGLTVKKADAGFGDTAVYGSEGTRKTSAEQKAYGKGRNAGSKGAKPAGTPMSKTKQKAAGMSAGSKNRANANAAKSKSGGIY